MDQFRPFKVNIEKMHVSFLLVNKGKKWFTVWCVGWVFSDVLLMREWIAINMQIKELNTQAQIYMARQYLHTNPKYYHNRIVKIRYSAGLLQSRLNKYNKMEQWKVYFNFSKTEFNVCVLSFWSKDCGILDYYFFDNQPLLPSILASFHNILRLDWIVDWINSWFLPSLFLVLKLE